MVLIGLMSISIIGLIMKRCLLTYLVKRSSLLSRLEGGTYLRGSRLISGRLCDRLMGDTGEGL